MSSARNNSTHNISLSASYHGEYIALIAVNAVLSFTSTFGNMIFLAALRKSSSIRRPSKALLGGLALCNLGIGLFAHPLTILLIVAKVNDLLLHWPNSVLLRVRLALNVVGSFLVIVSILTMVAISVDRFLALHLRQRYQTRVTLKKVALFLSSLWVAAGVLSSMFTYIRELYNWILILTSAFGILLCTTTYTTIFFRLRNIQVFHQPQPAIQHQQQQFNYATYRRTVTTALYVYGAFLICCIPFFLFHVAVLAVDRDSRAGTLIPNTILRTVICLTATLNPILHAWRIREIRTLARYILIKICAFTN